MGPGDLSSALGVIGNVGHASVQEALRTAAERTRKAGKLIGTVGPTPEMVKDFIGWGYHFVAVASDMGMMMRQANQFLTALKPSLAKTLGSGAY
jgi:2-keto-3-deoxy-L-rhamnonate aldolase RhmA